MQSCSINRPAPRSIVQSSSTFPASGLVRRALKPFLTASVFLHRLFSNSFFLTRSTNCGSTIGRLGRLLKTFASHKTTLPSECSARTVAAFRRNWADLFGRSCARQHHRWAQLSIDHRQRVLRYGPAATGATRKKAVVAVARQLVIDLWPVRTGRLSAEQFGLSIQ
jgi:hypothetical protein